MKDMNFVLRAMKRDMGLVNRSHSDNNLVNMRMPIEPYVHRMYNVKEFDVSGNFIHANAIGQLVNALLKALMEESQLQKYIVFIPDDSIISMLKHTGYGVSMMMGKCLHWLVSQFDRALETRINALSQVKPGAVGHGEPFLIWCRLLEKQKPGNDSWAMVHRKFNIILEDALKLSKFRTVLLTGVHGPHSLLAPRMLDMHGNLNHEGQIAYWRFFSEQIRQLDIDSRSHLQSRSSIQSHHSGDQFVHYKPPARF